VDDKKRTEQDLRDAAKDVGHEIHMLNATARWLSSHDVEMSTGEDIAKACLESFVLHVRNLIDFLYPPGNAQSDDILAGHFYGDTDEWERYCPPKIELLEKAKKRVDKLAAHLTYSRSKLDKFWEFTDLQKELQRVIACFLSHLPPERMAWFAAAEEGPGGSTGAPSPPHVRITTGPSGPPASGGSTPSASSGVTGPAGPPGPGESKTPR